MKISERLRELGHAALAEEVAELETEIANLRDLAVATSKLAELGRSAAALNHELRQPVMAIKALAELVRDEPADAETVKAHAIIVREQAERMARLLTAFRGGSATPAVADGAAHVGEVAAKVSTLVAYRLKQRTALDLEVPVDLPPVELAPDNLEQVLLNLVVNAIDAVEDRGIRGGVVVRARADDGHVRIYVGDEGAGISPAIREHLFQPYFTTKGIDRGTGLGLVICREILRPAGGTIELCDGDAVARLSPWPRPVRTLFCVTVPTRNGGTP